MGNHGKDFDKGWIKISLHTEDKRLEFNIENSMPDHEYTKDGTGGIGLENVRRRLALLYPDKHELKILQQDNVFYVKLNILL